MKNTILTLAIFNLLFAYWFLINNTQILWWSFFSVALALSFLAGKFAEEREGEQ